MQSQQAEAEPELDTSEAEALLGGDSQADAEQPSVLLSRDSSAEVDAAFSGVGEAIQTLRSKMAPHDTFWKQLSLELKQLELSMKRRAASESSLREQLTGRRDIASPALHQS